MAEVISIVDPDNQAGTDYLSLNAFEAGESGTAWATNNDTPVAECRCNSGGSATADTTAVIFAGWTDIDSTYYPIVRPYTGHEASTAWDATKYRLSVSNDHALTVDNATYAKIYNIQIYQTPDAHDESAVYINGTPMAIIDKCFIKGNVVQTTYRQNGIYANCQAGDTIYIRNNIVVDFKRDYSDGILMNTGYPVFHCYNNTVYNCYCGVTNGGTNNPTYARNNISYNCTADFSGTYNTTDSNYNFSEDDTAPGANSIHGVTDGKTPDFVSAGTDFAIESTSDAIDAGIGPGSDANIPTTDIDGDTRSGSTCDIGVDEYVAGGSPVYNDAVQAADWRAIAGQNGQAPNDFLRILILDGALNADFLALIGQNGQYPADFSAPLGRDGLMNVEYLQGQQANRQTAIEFLALVLHDAEIPIDWQGAIVINSDAILPVDFLGGAAWAAIINIDWHREQPDDSVREQIIQAIVTKLADIRTANGYQTDIGEQVERARFGFGPQELPATSVFPLAETAEKRYGKSQQSMPILIEGQVLHESSDPSAIAEKILDDLIKCLTGVERSLPFTDGGPYEIKAGDVITGFISGASGRIVEVTVTSGSWAGEDAAGVLRLRLQSGTFQAEDLNIGQVLPEDRGITWTDLGQQYSQIYIGSLVYLESGICLAGTGEGGKILRSIDYGATWTDLGQQYSQLYIDSLAYLGNGIVLAGTDEDGKILRSTDYGATWIDLGQQYSQLYIYSLAYLENGICLAGTYPDGKILRSTDYGLSWTDLGQQYSQINISNLLYLENGICLAGTNPNGKILRSIDYGLSWTDLGQQFSQININSLAYLDNGICLAGTYSGGKILRSTDYGLSWTDLGQQYSQSYIISLAYLGNGIALAGTATDGKILRSIDYGQTWADLGQQASQTQIRSLACCDNGICLAGTYPNGKILRSADLSVVATAAGDSVYIERLGGLTDQIAYTAGGPENYPGSGDQVTGCPVTFIIKYTTRVGNPYSQ